MADKVDVFRRYNSDIVKAVGLKDRDEFAQLTVEFEGKRIIGKIAMTAYQTTGGITGASNLFTAVRMYIDGNPEEKKARINCALKIMDEFIPDIVANMREG